MSERTYLCAFKVAHVDIETNYRCFIAQLFRALNHRLLLNFKRFPRSEESAVVAIIVITSTMCSDVVVVVLPSLYTSRLSFGRIYYESYKHNINCNSLTCITRIGKPVSLASCSRMCRVGFGV